MSKGKVLQFKRPSASAEGLRFLYIEDEHARFRYKRESVEYYFEIRSNGMLSTDYALYTSLEGVDLVDAEDFVEADELAVEGVSFEARRIAKEQFDTWSDCTPGERIALSIQWSFDIIADLEKSLIEAMQIGTPRDFLDLLRDYADDIESMQARIDGLMLAQSFL